MPRLVSVGVKLQQITGLTEKDLTPWEEKFCRSMEGYLPPGDTKALSEKQLAIIDRIWEKHFA